MSSRFAPDCGPETVPTSATHSSDLDQMIASRDAEGLLKRAAQIAGGSNDKQAQAAELSLILLAHEFGSDRARRILTERGDEALRKQEFEKAKAMYQFADEDELFAIAESAENSARDARKALKAK